MPATHKPIINGNGRIIDCSCGEYRQEGVYGHPTGARSAFLTHVVQAIAARYNWPEFADGVL